MTGQFWCFGPFQLDPETTCLWRDQQLVPLPPKPFAVLAHLVAHAGEVVTKGELVDAVWPETAVSEGVLKTCINQVRKALGETAHRPQYIATLHRRGYRFLAPVTSGETHVAQATGDDGLTAMRGDSQGDDSLPVVATPFRDDKQEAMPRTRYARSGEVNIAYQVLGDGPFDLVYVPGWITHLEHGWQQPRVAYFIRRLASFARVILFDKRGTGLSDRVPDYPTLEDRMDDVRAVMDAVGSERAAIFGMSEGGNMSVLFTATYPERTIALAVYGIFAKRLWSPDYPWAPTPEERQMWFDMLQTQWGGVTDLDTLAPSLATDPDFVHWWSTYLRLGASPGSALALARFNTQIDIRHILPAIQVPTLVLQRADDHDVKVEEGRYIAARIPGAQYCELPGEDHLSYAGDIDALLDEVERFFTRQQMYDEVERVLATVLCLAVLPPATAADVTPWLSGLLTRFRGIMLGVENGALYASFDGPARAIRCACAVLEAGRERGFMLRAGLHTGECEHHGGQLQGLPLSIATELAVSAHPMEVVVTSTVKDLVAGARLHFAERGSCAIPQIAASWPTYTVNHDTPPAA